MKKLLFLFLLSPLALLSQNKIVIKASQVTVNSIAPIAASTVVANATGGIASPTAVQLGVGLTFSAGKLAIDTANFKDSIYALNGLQIIGTGFNKIGLGGFISQNTTISGSNLYAFTLDSMQAATGRGFRVNFGSDAGWDLPVRDSATGFWTRIPKGTVGQGLIMLGSGGIGWGTVSGSGSALVVQRITGGSSGTVTGSNYLYLIDPASFIAAYTATMPASPVDGQIVIFFFGGTITAGTVVTSFSIVANSGQAIIDNTPATAVSVTPDNSFKYYWVAANSKWYRFKP